ncbi:MAG: primosomal protein N', partial [Peptostreptococcaceae bacterium]
ICDNKGKIKVEKLKDIKNINSILDRMSKKNLVKLNWEYKDHKNEKKICYISLALDKNKIDEFIKINKINLGSKQKEIINFLKNHQNKV